MKKRTQPSILHQLAEFFGSPYHDFVNDWKRLTDKEKEQIKLHYRDYLTKAA